MGSVDGCVQVRLRSIDVQGFPLRLRARPQRVRQIVEELSSTADDLDLVLLQDVWLDGDLKQLHTACSKALPYMHVFVCGTLGSNTALFSRWPITEVLTLPFQSQGNLLPMRSIDFALGRAMCVATIAKAPGQTVTVVNVQCAPYRKPNSDKMANNDIAIELGGTQKVVIPHDACAPVRLAQTLQLAATVQRLVAAGEEVIVGGRLGHGASDGCTMIRAETALLTSLTGLHHCTSSPDGRLALYTTSPCLPSSNVVASPPAAVVEHKHNTSGDQAMDKAAAAVAKTPAWQLHATVGAAGARGQVQRDSSSSAKMLQGVRDVVAHGHKLNNRISIGTNLLGTAMLVLGIACIMVAGSLPVNNWQITIAGYVLLTTFGTLFLGISPLVSMASMFVYKREANALLASCKQLDVLIGQHRLDATGP